MGLLDNVLGMAQQALGQGQGAQGSPDLMSAVLGMVSNDSAHGGIAGLVQAFQNGGLGHVVQSWIGTGQNLPISAEQLQSVLGGPGGGGPLAEMAQKLGLNESEAAMRLSQVLPGLVDQLTPQGQVPQGGLGSLAELASQLLGGHKQG